jgi:hypothetical protein
MSEPRLRHPPPLWQPLGWSWSRSWLCSSFFFFQAADQIKEIQGTSGALDSPRSKTTLTRSRSRESNVATVNGTAFEDQVARDLIEAVVYPAFSSFFLSHSTGPPPRWTSLSPPDGPARCPRHQGCLCAPPPPVEATAFLFSLYLCYLSRWLFRLFCRSFVSSGCVGTCDSVP